MLNQVAVVTIKNKGIFSTERNQKRNAGLFIPDWLSGPLDSRSPAMKPLGFLRMFERSRRLTRSTE